MQILLTMSVGAPFAQNKASPPGQPMLPQDIPDGPWQDIAVDYVTNKGLIICNAFSKYPFAYKVSTKSAQSLFMHLLELISQHGPPSLLSTDNSPLFASDEIAEFLMCHCTEHHTSSPYFPRSNGFIERQVRTIKTALNTALQSKKPLEAVLLYLCSTPIGPNMPALWEILHNRNIQWPGWPSQLVDMEKIRNFLISNKQAQCDQFNKPHGAQAHPELHPGQEVLFRSLAVDEYILGTILEKATAPCSYIIEAQGKRYRGTREHVQPIHLNLPPQAQNHKEQHISGPSPPKLHIPRASLSISSLPRPSILARPPLPCHTNKVPSCIPHPAYTTRAVTTCPRVDLILHLSTLNPVLMSKMRKLRHQQHLTWHWPQWPNLRRSWKQRAPALWTAKQVLPHTHFALCCHSPITRQP